MFDHLREDLKRYGGPREQWRGLLWAPGAWAVVSYRFRRWVHLCRAPQPLRFLLNAAAAVSQLWIDIAAKIQIPATASIGPGLLIAHTGTIVLAHDAVLGRHCTLTHGVTLGHAGGSGRGGSPVLGDRVYLGPGSAVIGPITVGSDALIGLGAVVTKPVPPRGVMAGNPAVLLSRAGSFELIQYPGMERDLERMAALAERNSPAERNSDALARTQRPGPERPLNSA